MVFILIKNSSIYMKLDPSKNNHTSASFKRHMLHITPSFPRIKRLNITDNNVTITSLVKEKNKQTGTVKGKGNEFHNANVQRHYGT